MRIENSTLPGLMSRKEAELRQTFLRQVEAIPGSERIKRCIQCGTCTGSCPVSYAMDISPREVMALFRAGEMERILNSRTIWICASCYACTTRCPSGLKVTDIMYALKRSAMEQRVGFHAPQVRLLARLFTDNLMRYGRLHEGTLIRKYYTRTRILKFLDLLPLAKKMWKTKRVALLPRKIKNHASLARIIAKAREIELRHPGNAPEYSAEYVGYRALGAFELEQRTGERP